MLTPFDGQKNIDWKAFEALVEWYIAAGSQGLFASCLSSELYNLSLEERLQLTRRAVEISKGRIPVIAAGALGDTSEDISTAAGMFADTGIIALIILSNQFAREDESDDVWIHNAEVTLQKLPPDLPLGLYECPTPYKRVLSPKLMSWAVSTRRFRFMKDTCCDLKLIEEKLKILNGSVLRFYNANTPTMLPSLRLGGDGFSGVGCNLVPQLYAWLCKNYETDPQTAEELQAFLVKTSPLVDLHYPHSAETYMRLNGLPITPDSRLNPNTLTKSHIDQFPAFHKAVTDWEQRLAIDSPFDLIK